MKIIDYFFYLTYKFLNIKVGRNEDNSKWSALIHTTLYVVLFIDILIHLIELIYKNNLFKLHASFGFPLLLILFIISIFVLYLRFYKFHTTNYIENKYRDMSSAKKKYIKIIIFLLMLCIPVIWFYI